MHYCYAYGTLTGTATLLLRNADARTRGREDATNVFGVGAVAQFESKYHGLEPGLLS